MVGKGLLASDNALVLDNRTRPQVVAFSEQPSAFFAAFGHSMTKLGGLGVLTNTEGEIRSACDCGCVNWSTYIPWFRMLSSRRGWVGGRDPFLRKLIRMDHFYRVKAAPWEMQRTHNSICKPLNTQKGELPSLIALTLKEDLGTRSFLKPYITSNPLVARATITTNHSVAYGIHGWIVVACSGHAMVFCSEANLVNKDWRYIYIYI